MDCSVYTSNFTVYTVQGQVSTVQYYNVQCSVDAVQYNGLSVQCSISVFSVCCTLYSIGFSVYAVNFTLYTVQCSLYTNKPAPFGLDQIILTQTYTLYRERSNLFVHWTSGLVQ